jgi:SAM-dependent methyltransferase
MPYPGAGVKHEGAVGRGAATFRPKRYICDPRSRPGAEAMAQQTDRIFHSSMAEVYNSHLVPLIFEPYAEDLAERLAGKPYGRVLEVAAGTGVVTRRLAAVLPQSASIVATDLNQGMLDVASEEGTARTVEWRLADALQLPFPDGAFDAVVCQFGTMFFPDKPRAFAEARRVLRPGGRFVFSVWDRIEVNEFADTVTQALAAMFPADPPRFMARTPHGYWDGAAIRRDLAESGYPAEPEISTITARSRAASPRIPAIAFCQGTPFRNEIEARAPGSLDAATDRATEAIVRRFGAGQVDGRIQAHIIMIES